MTVSEVRSGCLWCFVGILCERKWIRRVYGARKVG